MTLARKYSKYNVLQQFVEMLLLQYKPWLVRYKKNKSYVFLARACYGMEWMTIFHIPYGQFSSVPYSIPYFHTKYQGKFKPEVQRNLYSIFATLSVPLGVVAREAEL